MTLWVYTSGQIHNTDNFKKSNKILKFHHHNLFPFLDLTEPMVKYCVSEWVGMQTYLEKLAVYIRKGRE